MASMEKKAVTVHHPFEPFVPEGCRFLLLGSFPGSRSTKEDPPVDDWYYGAPRNQFWPIMGELFPWHDLSGIEEKKGLFRELDMAITDVILSCERKRGSSLDSSLVKRVYNSEAVRRILLENPVDTVLFTGKAVMTVFQSRFEHPPNLGLVCLPSPSPAFFRMGIEEKVSAWRSSFARLGLIQGSDRRTVTHLCE